MFKLNQCITLPLVSTGKLTSDHVLKKYEKSWGDRT